LQRSAVVCLHSMISVSLNCGYKTDINQTTLQQQNLILVFQSICFAGTSSKIIKSN